MRALCVAFVLLMPLASATPIASTLGLAGDDAWIGIATTGSHDESSAWASAPGACARADGLVWLTLTVQGSNGDAVRVMAGGLSADATPGAPATIAFRVHGCVSFEVAGLRVATIAAYAVQLTPRPGNA